MAKSGGSQAKKAFGFMDFLWRWLGALVLVLATVMDALIFNRLAAVFDVQAYALSPTGLLVRAVTNAGIGILVFETIDRRFRPPARRDL